MRKLLFMLMVFLALPFVVKAATVIDTLGMFKEQVRQFSGIESTELLPDTTLTDFCYMAIVNTSVEAGGVESQFTILTVSEQEKYALPDSIVTILYTSLITAEGETFVIRAGYPQYFDGVNDEGTIGVADDTLSAARNIVPDQYHYWADTLQLMPAPIWSDDSLIIKCFVEHPSMTIGGAGDTTSGGANYADTNTIAFTHPDFTTAAIFLATGYSLLSVEEFEKATVYFNLYSTKKQELIARYQRRMDIKPTVSE